MVELFPASFSCFNNFSVWQSSIELEDKNLVFVSLGFEKDFFPRDPVLVAVGLTWWEFYPLYFY